MGRSHEELVNKPVHLSDLFEVMKGIEDFWFGIVKLPPR
jgi:hypothetical protein